jgi:transposase
MNDIEHVDEGNAELIQVMIKMRSGAFNSIVYPIIIDKWFLSWRSVHHDVIYRPYIRPRIISLDPGIKVFLTGMDSEGISYQIGRDWREWMILDTDMKKCANEEFTAKWCTHRCMVKNMQKHAIGYLVSKFDVVIMPMLSLEHTGIDYIDRGVALLQHEKFHRTLRRKMTVITPNERYTSRTCSQCKHLQEYQCDPWNRFDCESCHASMNRDVNAAINIAAKVLII